MQAQLACMLILCFTCGGLCSDVDQDQRVLEEELLSSIFNSKMKQNKQSAPYWRVSLVNLCRMVNSLRQEAHEENMLTPHRKGPTSSTGAGIEPRTFLLRHQCCPLHHCVVLGLCRTQYLEDNSDTPLKRKSPYILKRQASHTTKSRRPYILKRTSVY
uniref:Neurotensin/neuromedin N n=1 Tax=Sphaeramia orbicularis TaxID=375764 RepID=A0A672Z341_9TELE